MALATSDLDHSLVRQRLQQAQLGRAAAATETCVAVLARSLREDIPVASQIQNVTLTTSDLSNAAHMVLDLLLLVLVLTQAGIILILAGSLLLVVLLHAHAAGGLAISLLEAIVDVGMVIITHKLVRVLVYLSGPAGPLVFLRFFGDVVVGLIEVVRGRYDILVVFSATVGLVKTLSLILLLLLLGRDPLRALRPVRRVAQRLALLDLLVNDREVTLRVLLVKRCHAELLMDQGLLLAAGRPVAIVGVVAEAEVVLVLFGGAAGLALDVDQGVNWAYTTEEGLVLCKKARYRKNSYLQSRRLGLCHRRTRRPQCRGSWAKL